MATDTCIYKSVTLSANEVFVLPPGAVLISATDASAVTSSCGDVPEAELKCYKIKWTINKDPEGERTVIGTGNFIPVLITLPKTLNAWEDEDEDAIPITVDAITIGNQKVVTSFNIRSQSDMEGAITAHPAGSALTDRRYIYGENLDNITTGNWGPNPHFQSGFVWYELWFKTTEDIAKSVFLTFGGGQNENIGTTPLFTPAEQDCEDYPVGGQITC